MRGSSEPIVRPYEVGSLLPGLWLWFKTVLRRARGLSNQDELNYLGKEFA